MTQRNRLCGLPDPHANPAGDQEQKHPGAAPARSSKKVHFLPPVDRPAGRELQSSAKSPEELTSKAEICRFWKARQEMVELEQEQAGGLENRLLTAKLPPHLQAALQSDEMAQLELRSLSRWRCRQWVGSQGQDDILSNVPGLGTRGTSRCGTCVVSGVYVMARKCP